MGRIIRKSITDELLELKENFLPKRFGGDNDDGHRNDNPANRDPCLIRRSVVGHIEQTERLLPCRASRLNAKSQTKDSRGAQLRTRLERASSDSICRSNQPAAPARNAASAKGISMSNSARCEWVSQGLTFWELWLSSDCANVVRLKVSERSRRLSISRKSSAASLCGRTKMPQTSPRQPNPSVSVRRTVDPKEIIDAGPKI